MTANFEGGKIPVLAEIPHDDERRRDLIPQLLCAPDMCQREALPSE